MTLDELKEIRYTEIDMRTQEIIKEGFFFDGHTFSMSLNAQVNWSNFLNIPDNLFPFSVMDIFEHIYECSLANKSNFYYAALNWKNDALQSGALLKAEIKACIDEVCVNAIIDNR